MVRCEVQALGPLTGIMMMVVLLTRMVVMRLQLIQACSSSYLAFKIPTDSNIPEIKEDSLKYNRIPNMI